MFRLLLLVFFSGSYRGERAAHAQRIDTMLVPSAILGVLSIVGGWLVLPGHDAFSVALRASFANAARPNDLSEFNWLLSLAVLLLVVAGAAAAYALYQVRPQLRVPLRERFGAVRALLLNAYYVDVLYHWLFERPVYWLAHDFASVLDPHGFAGVPRLLAAGAARAGDFFRGWETGYLRRYGLTMTIGVLALLVYYYYISHNATVMPGLR